MTHKEPLIFKTSADLLSGTRYRDIAPQARAILHSIAKRTKRQAYVRSAYFSKQKIFFTHFWRHLTQKTPAERARRLRYLPAALDLIRNSKHAPITIQNPNNANELLHRFKGKTRRGDLFYVQRES